MLGLLLSASVSRQMPSQWFATPILPESTRRCQMYSFVDQNIPPLPRFATLAEWRSYKAQLRPRILRLIGIDDILAREHLKAIHRGLLDRDGYTIEKISYESYPGMYVPALVWVPKNLHGKAPAAVSISGHTYCDSKAADYVQARDYNLVRRGFIVISYDYFGCFERARKDACQTGVTGGEDHMNSLYSYTGRTPTGIEVLDGLRAVDYLYTRPDVDRARILFTGESGGGNSTYWVSALDERITLSVPVCSAGAFSQWIKIDDNYDWHQRPPGLRMLADIGTFYAMVAPRPLLVMNGRPDLAGFTLPDAMRSVAYARTVYALFGKADAIAFHESTTGHGYQLDKRIELYGWLNRWFFGGRMPHGVEELPYQAEPKDALRVGMPKESLSIPALARRWVEQCLRHIPEPGNVDEAHSWQQRSRARLEPLLARRQPLEMPGVTYRHDYSAVSGPYQAEKLQLEIAPDLILPGVLVRREGKAKYKTIVFLGKELCRSEEAGMLVEQGFMLLCLDPRGTGEVDWGGGRTSNWADFLGRPPVGMWSEDISKVITFLLDRPDVERVGLVGYGVFGKAALYAAAIDERIAAVAVTLDTASYRQEATSGLVHVFADVPRILTWGDTPQIAALIGPRPVTVLSAGVPVSYNEERPRYFSPLPRFAQADVGTPDEELRTTYEWTRGFYRTLGAERNFETGMSGERRAAYLARWFAGHL
jgi:cephalosporin-C deacetylase-like acetyl esterase